MPRGKITAMSTTITRVAVLDDDRLSAEAVRDVLLATGLQAVAFISAAVLLDAQQQGDGFAAFVVDWMLGAETAEALIRQLRRLAPYSPIYLLSGQLSRNGQPIETLVAALMRECDVHFIPKPFSNRLIAQRIRADVETARRDHGGQ